MIHFNTIINNWKPPALPGVGEFVNVDSEVTYHNRSGGSAYERYYSKNLFGNAYNQVTQKVCGASPFTYSLTHGIAYDVPAGASGWETIRTHTHYNTCYNTCHDVCYAGHKCNACGGPGEWPSNCQWWGMCDWYFHCNPHNCNGYNCNPWNTHDQVYRNIYTRYYYTPHQWNYEGMISKNYSHRTI